MSISPTFLCDVSALLMLISVFSHSFAGRLWVQGAVDKAIKELINLSDAAVAVDFLTFAEDRLKGNLLTLDMCLDLLPLLHKLLLAPWEA